MSTSDKEIKRHQISMMRGRVYKHWKGDQYMVLGPVMDATRDEWVVGYQKEGDQLICTRTLEDFQSLASVPRFQEVG
jgi:hypothetical protein